MNWYKSSQQMAFPFLENQKPTFQTSIPEWDQWWDNNSCDEIEEKIEECSTHEELYELFRTCNVDYDKIETPSGIIYTVLIEGNPYVVEDFSIQKADEWVQSVSWSGRVEDYIASRDFNKDFWESAQGVLVYHGTTEERIQDILANGLEPRDETRGIANRSMGAGIFTSPSAEIADNYYDKVIEIDVGAMAADGFVLPVSMEGPIAEGEAEESLAHLVGLEGYYVDVEQGLDPGTVVFYGVIPPEFLRLLE